MNKKYWILIIIVVLILCFLITYFFNNKYAEILIKNDKLNSQYIGNYNRKDVINNNIEAELESNDNSSLETEFNKLDEEINQL